MPFLGSPLAFFLGFNLYVVVNLALGFLIPGVSWQSHVGGLLVGAACAAIMLRTRRADQQRRQALLIAAVAAVLVAATVVRVLL